ncbi:MAG TPA: cyclopropane-fatty-acyl-phospholipid synthase family protein [Xanthomonadaceae bacterium]|jgi:cyclopropane-fatty-acyl-phospholipid synthase
MSLISLCEQGWIPDALTRRGIRGLCEERLRQEHAGDPAAADANFRRRLAELRDSALAIETGAANRQHYEVPTEFFRLCLGKRLKYSSCYYPTGRETLDAAEEAMLALYGERAGLADGQAILELGCGWGSLTLWMAERYPNARIVGVSNSASQREHILGQCRERGLANVAILTRDVNALQVDARFDRVVSVEMFEHVRNYRLLFERIAGWLEDDGSLFAHIFCHRHLMYPFEDQGRDDWMARHFFTGGLMPAADTFLHFRDHLVLRERWLLPGTHYQRTANHWLENQDAHRKDVLRILEGVYGKRDARVWSQRWRMFWMACAELFGYRDGSEWLVAHYRFDRR